MGLFEMLITLYLIIAFYQAALLFGNAELIEDLLDTYNEKLPQWLNGLAFIIGVTLAMLTWPMIYVRRYRSRNARISKKEVRNAALHELHGLVDTDHSHIFTPEFKAEQAEKNRKLASVASAIANVKSAEQP
jgi:hypothetical protein